MNSTTQGMHFADNNLNSKNFFPALFILQWLTLISALIFASWLVWHYGFIQNIVRTDITRLSVIIILFFLGGSVHCATRCIFLSRQNDELGRISADITNLQFSEDGQLYLGTLKLGHSPIVEYINNAVCYRRLNTAETAEQQRSRLDEVLIERLKGSHEAGWFLTGLLVKIGLLGTVIGFILMLTSVSTVVTLDPSQIHLFFSEMTHGMRVALNTTLAGLLGTMLLGFQYLLLDRNADKLLADTIDCVEKIRL